MKHKWLWGAVGVFLALLAVGLARLRLDVEVLNLLPQKVPVVQGLKLYQQHFADSKELILTLNGPSAESTEMGARLCAEALNQATNLIVRAVWQPPWLEHPEHMAELIACLWLNQPPEVVAALTNRLAGELGKELAAAREELATTLSPTDIARLAYDPLGLTRLPGTEGVGGMFMGQNQDFFSGDDGKFRIVFAEPKEELKSYRRATVWMAEIHKIIDARRAKPDWPGGVVVAYTGGPPFLAETGTRMQSDMQGCSFGTLAVVAGLFWWAHRRLVPLLCQTGLVLLVVLGTMALGGLIFGKLSVISLGFAAILMGLADDFGLILYQEWTAMPNASSAQLRKLLGSSIGWSAVATAGAFALLNFGGLPGLSQLGSLVAMGILLAAVVMLFAFLPLARKRSQAAPPPNSPTAGLEEGKHVSTLEASEGEAGMNTPALRPDPVNRLVWGATAVIAIGMMSVLVTGLPKVDHGITALQLTDCQAQNALEEMQNKLNREEQPMLLVFSGRDEGEISQQLQSVTTQLETWQTNGQVKRFMLPTLMWPNPERQKINRVMLGQLAGQRERFREAVQKAGFTSDAFALTTELTKYWEKSAPGNEVIWPTNSSCQWLQKRFAARSENGWLALGMFNPASKGHLAEWQQQMASLPQGVWLTSWSLLGEGLLEHVRHRLGWLMLAMAGVLALCLWLAFRRVWEVALSFFTLAFSGLAVLTVMRLVGWSWNMMNFMALPLWLGAGVDYAIHVQLALRRSGGNVGEMRKVTGRALFLCAGTTVAGFGSLAWSSSAGLSSMGLICSTGIVCVFLTSSYLLPEWWKALGKRMGMHNENTPHPSPLPVTRGEGTGMHHANLLAAGGSERTGIPHPHALPSGDESAKFKPRPPGIYRGGLWRGALVLARLLPDSVLLGLSRLGGELYYRTQKERVEVLIQNLLPLCGSRAETETVVRRLFRNFAAKLANLWKFEGGECVNNWMTKPEEWAIIQAAQKRGQGLLFVTLHLGDWEHGGLLLAQRGIRLMVLTLAEPGAKFTEVRSAARARWGIETLVIGEDSFAFVDVIKRLQEGGAVALSIDRPPARGGVPVEFFGRPFRAPNGAAELARASGCAVLGVVVTRCAQGIRVRVLPEFTYDRQKLGDREARRQMTQEILRAFEPEIRQHLDQWYQFVPIWGKPEAPESHGR